MGVHGCDRQLDEESAFARKESFITDQLLRGARLLDLVLLADGAPDAELIDDAEEVLGAVLLAQHGV